MTVNTYTQTLSSFLNLMDSPVSRLLVSYEALVHARARTHAHTHTLPHLTTLTITSTGLELRLRDFSAVASGQEIPTRFIICPQFYT